MRPARQKRNRPSGRSRPAVRRPSPSSPTPPFSAEYARLGYRALLEHGADIVIGVGDDGTILEWNQRAESILGWSRAQAIGQEYLKLCVPERFRATVLSEFDQLLAGGGRWAGDRAALTREGEERLLSWEIFALRDAASRPVGILAIGSDPRDREEALTALHRSRAQLEGIIASAMDAIITVDDQQHILLFNQAAERMFGCAASDVVGAKLDRFIPPRFREAHQTHLRQFGESGVTNRRMGRLGTVTGCRSDGQEFPAEASISQIRAMGQTFYTVILRDVTERHQADVQLRQERDFIATVLNTANAFVVVLDEEGRAIRCNRVFEEETGFAFAEFQHQPFWEFFLAPEELGPARRAFDTVCAGRFLNGYETSWRVKHGARRQVAWNASGILDHGAQLVYVVCIGLDMTNLRKTEAQLRRTERLAELGTLASGMAHEIGTPMNVILGRAEYLMRRTQEDATRKGLETIVSQVERIDKIMNQLLTFARRRPMDRRAMDIRVPIADCLDVVQERLLQHEIRVQVDVEQAPKSMYADPDQMSQVLLNLVLNAMHAMPGGGTLRVEVRRDCDQVKLAVSDTGEGIPAELVSKIFDPFFTTKDVGKGTGLGLTVVHGIVQEHGGTIQVETEVGRGTTFIITLPLH